MGLFSKKVCVRCGKECGVFSRTSTEDDKVLCSECAKLAGPEFDGFEHTYDQYLAFVERYNENEKKLQEFHIDESYYDRIFIDSSKNWIAITKDSLFKAENMYNNHPHVYDIKDLKFFHMSFKTKKSETSLFSGTTMTMDYSMVMAFEDELVPCPLNDTIATDRKVTIKGSSNKAIDGFLGKDELAFFLFMNLQLSKNGIEKPIRMQKGDTVESLDKYATWFNIMFDLEKKNIIKHDQVTDILFDLTEDLGVIESVKTPSKIRTHFGAGY